MVECSDVFIGLVGSLYGSPLPCDDRGRSIVEWEFETACARETIELLLFLKVAEATIEPAQQRFRDRISNFRGGYWCKSYASPDELVLYGLRSLMRWLCEFWAGVMEERSRRARRRQVALASFAAATVASRSSSG